MIYLFTCKKYLDPSFEELADVARNKFNIVNVWDESFLENQISCELLANTLCIFDDISNFTDTKIQKEIYRIRNDILENGRVLHISCYCSNHALKENSKTKTAIKECNNILGFINDDIYHWREFLIKELGLTKQQTDSVLNSRSRWFMISKLTPRYVITEHSVMLL